MSKKTSIPGMAFVIIGGIVSLFSYYLDNLRNESSLLFFFYVGILFIFYGIIKIIIKQFTKTSKNKEPKKYKHTPEYYKKDHTYKFCHKCGSKLRSNFNFCYNCGERVI